MSVNSYLSDLASNLVLSINEKESITTSINTINTRLSINFGNEIKDKFLFGSYTRETILPRKADENSDIDLMVVFDNSNRYTPQTFLNPLKKFAETYYNSSEIYQSSPTIVLELNHIKFELVPAYYNYLYYNIPDKTGGWMSTDPNGFNNDLIECNKNNGFKIKPVVRLIKHWNIKKNYRNIASFDLEKKLASELKYAYLSNSSYTDYLLQALTSIHNYLNASCIDAAKSHIRNSLEFEDQNMPSAALLEIKKAFPEV